MTTAYIARLNRQLEAIGPPEVRLSLHQRFIDWYAALPEIARDRPFAMAELEAALSTQGRFLSPVLLSLGWERRRRWISRGPYSRYWLPPEP